MKKNILKLYTISCTFLLLLYCQQLIAQPLPNLQTRIFNEANLLRKNPALYYQKYKNLFDKEKSGFCRINYFSTIFHQIL